MFSKEKKGMNCVQESDGSIVCRRIQRNQKSGDLLTDGQTVVISADPSNNCEPRFENLTVLDDEFPEFEKIAKRVSAGCRRASQPQQSSPTEGVQ